MRAHQNLQEKHPKHYVQMLSVSQKCLHPNEDDNGNKERDLVSQTVLWTNSMHMFLVPMVLIFM